MMLHENKYKAILEQHNLRKTFARVEILKSFYNKPYAISHGNLETMLSNKLDRVTIYRTLSSFEEKGLVHKVYAGSGAAKYALCSKNCTEYEHHDDHVHFSCIKCGNTYCIENIQIPPITIPEKYKTKNLYLIAEGICSTCTWHWKNALII